MQGVPSHRIQKNIEAIDKQKLQNIDHIIKDFCIDRN